MDPASLAIGVLPLIINIGQVSSSVRQQVSNYKAASTDIQNILDKTDLIDQVCSRLEIDLRSSSSRYETPIIEQALKRCYMSVFKIHSDLEGVASQKAGRKRSMKYVFSKFHIDRSLTDLNESISMLNTCISLCTCLTLNAITNANTHTYLGETEGPLLAQQSSSQSSPPAEELIFVREPTKGGVASKAWTTSHRSSWHLYETSIGTTSDENDDAKCTYRSYLVGSPLVGAFISVAMRYGRLSPFSLTLDMPRFIYEEHEVTLYETITRSTPGSGATSQDVARWMNRFNIKPNTQFIAARDGVRKSTLGVLVASNKNEAFEYLTKHGGQQLSTEQHIFCGVSWSGIRRAGHLEIIRSYIKLRGPLLTLEEYGELLIPSRHPTVVVEIFDLCRDIFVDEFEDFLVLTMEVFMYHFRFSYNRVTTESLASSVSKLLAAGLDIHQERRYVGDTALYGIMTCHFATIIESLELSMKWVEVLKHTSVDVDRYLFIEVLISVECMHPDGQLPPELFDPELESWLAMDIRKRLEIIFDILNPGRRVPLYVYLGSTTNLRQIMPTLQECRQIPLSVCGNKEPSHLEWKRSRLADAESSMESWPFLASTRSIDCWKRGFQGLGDETIKALATHDRYLELISERFERRQEKKWKRLKKLSAITEVSERMPGGWELEWCEYRGSW